MNFYNNPIPEVIIITNEFIGTEIPQYRKLYSFYRLNPFPLFSKELISELLDLNNTQKVCSRLLKEGYSFPFIHQSIEIILKKKIELNSYDFIWILNSAVAWIIYFERTKDMAYVINVLDSLILACNGPYTSYACSLFTLTLKSVLEISSNDYSVFISPIVSFFSADFQHPADTAQIIPLIVSKLYDNTKGSTITDDVILILNSFVIWLESGNLLCPPSVIENIVSRLLVSIFNFDTFSLKFLMSVIDLGPREQFEFLFKSITPYFCKFLRDEENPVTWKKNEKQENILESVPMESISNYVPCFPETIDLASLIRKEGLVVIDKIVPLVEKKTIYAEKFIDELLSNITNYENDESFGNIVAGVITTYGVLRDTYTASSKLINSCIFDPSITVFTPLKGFEYINSLRNLAIRYIIEDSGESLALLLTKVTCNPLIFAETVYRLLNLHEKYYKNYRESDLAFKIAINKIPMYINALRYDTNKMQEKENLVLLNSIFSFFTVVSKTLQLPNDTIKTLTSVLRTSFDNNPPQEVYEKIIRLMKSDNEADLSPNFIIISPATMKLFIQVFFNTDRFNDVIEFINKMLDYSTENAVKMSNAEVDILFLSLIDSVTNDEQLVREILYIFKKITTVLSTPLVVKTFFSLISPVNGKLKPYYIDLMQTLWEIVSDTNWKTNTTSLLGSGITHDETFRVNKNIANGFSFSFWYLCHNSNSTQCLISTISIGNLKVEVIEQDYKIIIKNYKDNAELAQFVCPFEIRRRLWEIVIISYSNVQNNTVISFKTEHEEGKIASIDNLFIPEEEVHVTIGCENKELDKSHCAEIGSAFISPLLSPPQLREVISLVPLTTSAFFEAYKWFVNKPKQLQANKSFSFTLTKMWKVDLALPLFSLFNVPLYDGVTLWEDAPSSIISIFTKILVNSDAAQRNFYESKKFSYVAYLLSQYPPEVLTFDVYMQFYTMYQTFSDANIKKQIFGEILTAPYVWLTTTADDHLKILKHWSRSLFPGAFEFITDVMSFKNTVCMLPLFYWYKSTKNVCFGEPNSERPRAKDLDVTSCRKEIFKCLLFIATLSFSVENLVDIFLICQSVIEDEEQVISMLSLAESLIPRISSSSSGESDKIKIGDLAPLLELVTTGSEGSILGVFKVALAMIRKKTFSEQILHNFFDVLIFSISSMSFSSNFFDQCLLILNNNPEFFGLICCYAANHADVRQKLADRLADRSNQGIVYIEPYCEAPNWFEWPLLLCFVSTGTQQEDFINFIVKSRIHNIINLCCCIDITCKVSNTDPNEDVRQLFLKKIINEINEENMNLDEETLNQFLGFVVSFIFYRITNSDYNSPLEKEFMDSPFSDELTAIKKLEMTRETKSIMAKNYKKIDFNSGRVFQLRINEDKEWLDLPIAESFVSLVFHKKAKQFLNLSYYVCFIIARFDDNFVKQTLEKDSLSKISPFYSILMNRISNKEDFIPLQLCQDTLASIQNNPRVLTDYIAAVQEQHVIVTNIGSTMVDSVSERTEDQEKLVTIAGQKLSIKNRTAEKNWNQIWSSLTAKRGPWASFASKTTLRWKRDDTPCYAFCPSRLKLNKHFNDHADASYKRDNVKTVGKKENQGTEESHPKYNMDHSLFFGVNYILTLPCKLVKVNKCRKGNFALSSNSIDLFFDYDIITIPISDLKYVLLRSKYHKKTAIEIFTLNGPSYFINFNNLVSKTSLDILNSIKKIAPKTAIVQNAFFAPYFNSLKLTKQWESGKLSNFEYLMYLNVYSGRSFNDTAQYPIFPVIVVEKEKEKLDLSDPTTFRDLSKPIGALNPTRLEMVYTELNDRKTLGITPDYLYNSGPVSRLTICAFLLRLEPFTSLHIDLQSGKFDIPDRQVIGINDLIESIYNMPNDFREMIPEFYFQPDFLVNSNNFDLGVSSTGVVDDIILPPWAKTPIEYVYNNRKALESDYVSEHISDWIDLLWGYKQRGEASVKADNYYLRELYEDSWELQNSVNEKQHKAFLKMIGQIPPQLFTVPHPKKMPAAKAEMKEYSIQTDCNQCIFAHYNDGKLILVTSDSKLHILRESVQDSTINLNALETREITKCEFVSLLQQKNLMFEQVGNNEFICTVKGGKNLFHVNIKDFDCTKIITPLQSIAHIASNNIWYAVSGTENATSIYRIDHYKKIIYTSQNYRDGIVCSCLSDTYNVLIIGTRDEGLVVTSLSNGITVRAIEVDGIPVRVAVSESWGFIVSFLAKPENMHINKINVYTINGDLVISKNIDMSISGSCIFTSTRGFDYISVVTKEGDAFVAEIFYLDFERIATGLNIPLARYVYSDNANSFVAVEKSGKIRYIPYTPPTF